MKKIHPPSLVFGIVSGIVLLAIGNTAMGVFAKSAKALPVTASQPSGTGPNVARMAQRFGMTEADLQKELDAGKTVQQIAQEHGVQFTGRRNGSTASTGVGPSNAPVQASPLSGTASS